ncbi:MAG: Hsp70 family protein, partial [Lachnospiraceae bacterium]|nr:Hsp70 family protein [Lachnospiraceae bacterium]
DFAESILTCLNEESCEEARNRLFIIARKIGSVWTESQKSRLATICLNQIHADLHGMFIGGPKVSTNIQAILTMSICASEYQLQKLSVLHDSTRYLQACLYTHAKTKTDLAWIKEELEKDMQQANKKIGSNLQFSAHAMGIVLRNEGVQVLDIKTEERIVNKLAQTIRTGNLTGEELISSLLALGWICDQREFVGKFNSVIIHNVLDTIQYIEDYYPVFIAMHCNKAKELAVKMINGDSLSEDEEAFLLIKLEK